MREMTVVALYDEFADAKAAMDDLVQAGVAKDQISLLANGSSTHHPGLLSNPAYAREDMEKPESDATSGLGLAVEIGAGLGGILGLLVGVGTITIPGIGPLIAAGAWVAVAAGAAVGGIAGGVVGWMTDRGVSDDDAHLYAEGLRRGGTLITAHVPEGDVEKTTQLFKARGAVDIEKRGAAWRAEGWVSFDPESRPLTAAEIAALREREAAAGHEAEHHHQVRHYFRPSEPGFAGISNETTHYGKERSGE